MAGPIYQLFLAKPTEAWFELSPEERDKLQGKVNESLEEHGAEQIVLCNSSWSSEQWAIFGVLKFPDVEAVQKHREEANNLEWPRYLDSMSVLGTEWEPS